MGRHCYILLQDALGNESLLMRVAMVAGLLGFETDSNKLFIAAAKSASAAPGTTAQPQPSDDLDPDTEAPPTGTAQPSPMASAASPPLSTLNWRGGEGSDPNADSMGLTWLALRGITRHAAAPWTITQFLGALEQTLAYSYPHTRILLSPPAVYMRFMHDIAAAADMDQWLADVIWGCLQDSTNDGRRDSRGSKTHAEVRRVIREAGKLRASGRDMLDYLVQEWGPWGNPPVDSSWFDQPSLDF